MARSFLLVASYPDSLLKFRGPLLDALLAQGLQVHVAVPYLAPNSALYLKLTAKGLHLHPVPLQRTGMNPLADSWALYKLFVLMRRIKPDYVLGYTIKPVIYGALAAKLACVPHRYALITGLGYAFTGNSESGKRGLLRKLVQRLYASALSSCHKVFFQNPDDEALFRQLDILSGYTPSIVVNGSGVDVAEYAPVPLPTNPCFLLIARLLGDKGIREYVAAAQKVKSRYPQTRFTLVGWIDENPDAINQKELDQWIEAGTIEYLGKLDDVRPVISHCSIYVLPSYREGTPRTVLEAMAMGRAVITTDAPGCRETVIDGDNGFLVPVKEVDLLVQAMERFIIEPELVMCMGLRGREIAEKKYDVHKVNNSMLKEMGIIK